MKLDWKRAGNASIAACGKFTAICYRHMDDEFFPSVVNENGRFEGNFSHAKSLAEAEAQCESWLEQHDRPEWHDVTDWLSWAEWRGREVSIHTYTPVYGGSDRRWWVDISPSHTHGFDTLTEAKEYAEKWIRERSA